MNQQQLELPQLSLARYLDLLKRRRWQVVPVSLLGLLIGGIVAFFIPRYYVSQLRIEHRSSPGEQLSARAEDPFSMIVSTAIHTIRLTAGETMRRLNWLEASEPDPSLRAQIERDVESRIQVYDANAGEKGRGYALLHVEFKDRDGQRAAAFLNKLVETWIEQEVARMRASVEGQLAGANQRLIDVQGEFERLNTEIGELATRFGIDRAASEAVQREEMRIRGERLVKLQDARREAIAAVAALELQISDLEKRRDTTKRVLDAANVPLVLRLKDAPPSLMRAAVLLEALKKGLKDMRPAHPDYEGTLAKIAEVETELGGGTEGSELVNPVFAELQKQIDAKSAELAKQQALLKQMTIDEEAERTALEARNRAHTEFFAKITAREAAQKKIEVASEANEAARMMKLQLDQAVPIRVQFPAQVPKRPTEPNILLVAILGCVVGLGAAIGLILLIDVLQGTLKTVDDVERALPVPVLGGVSHVETVEERARLASGRRRVSLMAGAILFGAVIVVTTYYVAPHRLPPFARDFLSMVLGG